MSLIIDIVLIIIIALCIYTGYKNGFIKTVLKLFSGVAAFLFAYIFSPILSKLFYNATFGTIKSVISEKLLDAAESDGVSSLFSENGAISELGKLIESCGLSIDELKTLASSFTSAEDISVSLAEKIAAPAANAISYVIAFIILFIIGVIAVTVLSGALNLVSKLPVINGANKLLGLLLGILTAIVFSTVYMTVIKLSVPYLSVVSPDTFPSDVLDKAYVFNFVYKLNILKKLFEYANISASLLK